MFSKIPPKVEIYHPFERNGGLVLYVDAKTLCILSAQGERFIWCHKYNVVRYLLYPNEHFNYNLVVILYIFICLLGTFCHAKETSTYRVFHRLLRMTTIGNSFSLFVVALKSFSHKEIAKHILEEDFKSV